MKTSLYTLVILGLLTTISASACSSSESTPPAPAADGGDAAITTDAAPTDSSADGNATTDAPSTKDAASTCNDVVNAAPEATSATVKGNAPAATGGTIAAGTYFLTEFTLYDPDGTPSAPAPSGMKATLVIAGNVMDSVMDLGDGVDRTFSETFTVSGTDLDRVLTCPKPGPDLDAVYSVSGSELVVYETDPASSLIAGSKYVKQ